MKILAFVCLLKLAMCIALLAEQSGAQLGTTVPVPHDIPQAPGKPEENATAVQPTKQNTTFAVDTKTDDKKVKPEAEKVTEATPVSASSVPASVKPDEHASTKDNKVVDKETKEKTDEEKKGPVSEPTKIVPEHQTEAAKKSETSSSTEAKKEDATTPKSELAKSTEAPTHIEPTVQARAFDGPSFVGGIILTLGLLAIGFMGFKYYKNHTERNYHTL